MTISTLYSPDTYAGNGATTTFAITFDFIVSTNVKVSIKVDSTGVITEKVAGTHYNVSSTNVIFTAGNIPASGQTIIIELDPDFLQASDYAENSVFPAETLEDDLDTLCLAIQVSRDAAERAVKVDSSVDLTVFDATLPDAVDGGIIGFNSDSTGLAVLELGDISAVSLPLAISQGGTGQVTAAAAIEALGVGPTDSPEFTAIQLGHSSDTTLSRASSGRLAVEGVNVVTTSSTDTLTNKTINADGTGNVITNIGSSEVKSELITGMSTVTAAAGDLILIADVSDSNNLKKVTAQTIIDLVSGSLVKISSQTASTSASLSFTGLSATYSQYIFVIDALLPATDNVALYMRTSTDGGSTYASTNEYNWCNMVTEGDSAYQSVGANASSAINLCGSTSRDEIGNVANSEGVTGEVKLYNPSSTTHHRTTGQFCWAETDGTLRSNSHGGQIVLASDIDAVQFLFSSGNITSGKITMYGMVA